jgi:hypothetical protein
LEVKWFLYSHLRCSPYGPASPFAPPQTAQWSLSLR